MNDRIYWNCAGCGRQWSCPNPTYWTPNTMHACRDGAMVLVRNEFNEMIDKALKESEI